MRILLAVLLVGCASRQGGAGARASDPSLISAEQLRQQHYENAYDAVSVLHSNWLQSRGRDSFQSPTEVLVYLDNTRLGGVEQLRTISVLTISSIRRIDGTAASARWGLGHGAGVIHVETIGTSR